MNRSGCMRLAPLLAFILLTGCSYHKKIPPGVIPKDKMEKILWDMVQADRFASGYILTKKDPFDKKKDEAALFYERVFSLHGITREEFVKSYKYYLGRPDITKILFDSITVQAERRRDQELQRVQDSVAKRHRDSIELLNAYTDSIRASRVRSVWQDPPFLDSIPPITTEDALRQQMKFQDSARWRIGSDSLWLRLRSRDTTSPLTAEDSFRMRLQFADSVLNQ